MSGTKVIIAGSRDFNDYELLRQVMNSLGFCDLGAYQCEVISGTARGADRLGEQWAREYGFSVIRMPADWESHGKAAGYIRNEEMAKIGTHLVAFWDGQSRGTRNMIHIAQREELKVHVHNYSRISPQEGYEQVQRDYSR